MLKIKSPIFIGTLTAVIIALIAFVLLISFSSYTSGEQIRPYDARRPCNL